MPGYKEFVKKVNAAHGIDLSLYKETQMKRRITSLRNNRGFTSYDDYFNQMKSDRALLNEFIDRLTINVTEFYRNPKRWTVLQNKVIPELIKGKSRITIWSAACSTGEEPYSLAILLKEHFPEIQATIIATDIDENALQRAKEGEYLESALKDLPPGLKEKYFSNTGSKFKVNDTLKRTITFKRHNLLADRYPTNNDLIVCRNVLIYFTDEAKESIYQNFNDGLRDGGILFVGSTEQIFNPDQYNFDLYDTFFYQKKK